MSTKIDTGAVGTTPAAAIDEFNELVRRLPSEELEGFLDFGRALTALSQSDYPAKVPGYYPVLDGVDTGLHLAINGHWSAWVHFQIAEGVDETFQAQEAEADAMLHLLATPVVDVAGLRALMAHLAWYAAEEQENRAGHDELSDLPFVMLDTLQMAASVAASAVLDAIEARKAA
jgi:hypothetical protein